MTTTAIQLQHKVKDVVINYNQGDFFLTGTPPAEIAIDLIDLPSFMTSGALNTAQTEKEHKQVYELQSISLKFKATEAKGFRIEFLNSFDGTAVEKTVIKEETAFTPLSLILMKGQDFDGLYAMYEFNPTTIKEFKRLLSLAIPVIAGTPSDSYVQCIATWKEIQE